MRTGDNQSLTAMDCIFLLMGQIAISLMVALAYYNTELITAVTLTNYKQKRFLNFFVHNLQIL
jgi:hypothetical protein